MGIGRGSADDERPCRPPLDGFCNLPDGEAAGLDEDAAGVGAGVGDGRDVTLLGADDGLWLGEGEADGRAVDGVFLGINSGIGILLRWIVRVVRGLYDGLDEVSLSLRGIMYYG